MFKKLIAYFWPSTVPVDSYDVYLKKSYVGNFPTKELAALEVDKMLTDSFYWIQDKKISNSTTKLSKAKFKNGMRGYYVIKKISA